jgi:chaperonin GroEL
MAHKKILFDSAAREKVLVGATALADAVRVTLGPKSKCVLIGKKWGSPIVCNDGVTIAKEIELKDPEEDLGARMLREAAVRTGDTVGDGTTTSTILAHSIYAEGLKNVAAGASAIDLKRGLDRGLKIAVEAIRKISRPVQSKKEKAQIATVSAHNDQSIGELVAEAIERIGPEGVSSVEEAKGTETELELVEGMKLDRGYLSAYFVTDPRRMECVLEEPLILIHDKRIATLQPLLPLLEQVAKEQRPLLVIAEEVEGEALATLVVNRLRGTLACAAIKAPGFGDRRKAILEDLAVLTGGKLISEEVGMKLDNVLIRDLGRASRVVIDQESTAIIGGRGDKTELEGRIEQLRRQIKDTTGDYDREKLEERLAKLVGGVAVIRVGAPSEAELKSRREAFDDALSATKAAIVEGIVPGAGLALLRAIEPLHRESEKAEGDVRTGMRILEHALEAPTRQIAENSDADGGVVVEKMRSGTGSFGFDASTGRYLDLMEAGIIDPTKVVRIALENAVSVASLLLLTEATLTEVPEPPPQRMSAEVEATL